MIHRATHTDPDRTTSGPSDPSPAPEPPTPETIEARLLAGTPVGVLTCDERRVVRSANPAALRLLPGLTVGEALTGPELAAFGAGAVHLDGGRVAVGEPGADPAAGVEVEVGGRVLAAHLQALPDGWVGWHLLDVTAPRARLDALLAECARARFLAEASRRLGRSLHPGRTARTVAELAAGLADTAMVVLAPVAGAVQWLRRDGDRDEVGWVVLRQLPEVVAATLNGYAAAPDPWLPAALAGPPWAAGPAPATAAVVALPGEDKPAGALVLLRGDAADPVDERDEQLILEFAERAGSALTAAALYTQRARTAEGLERSVLDPQLPTVAGIVLGAAHRPADPGLLIGGDFYDVQPTRDGGADLLVGDVCGKGVDAAVCAGQVRQSLRVLRRTGPVPGRLLGLLDLLNTVMLDAATPTGTEPRFATLVLGTARALPGGGVRLHLAGGGHPPPIVVRPDRVEPVEIGGALVGALRPARFRERTLDLGPGEACVFYTDGIVEARGGPHGEQMFGEPRLAELLRGCHVLPAPGIVERVLDHVTRWLAGRCHDDMAVLVVQAPVVPTTSEEASRTDGRDTDR